MQEIGEIPFTNSLHTFVFSLLQKGRVDEAMHHYKRAQEYESWLLTDEQLRKQRCRRVNLRNKKHYGAGYSSIKNHKLQLYKNQKFRCNICKDKKPISNLEIDHIKAIAQGGTNDIDNLQLLCNSCHKEKDSHLMNQPLEAQLK